LFAIAVRSQIVEPIKVNIVRFNVEGITRKKQRFNSSEITSYTKQISSGFNEENFTN
jgi:hypothetical protein